MKKKEEEIITKLESYLDASKYKIFRNSIKHFEVYSIIHYQSISIVDFNIPDDDMIYGVGILMYRRRDSKIFEIHCQSNQEEQIRKRLNEN